MKEIYSLEIWLVNTKYYLRAYSVTTVGLRDANGNPIHVVENSENIGEEVLSTLKECKQAIPHPDYRVRQVNEMLTVTGLKTEKAIMRKGKTLTCYLQDKNLEIKPWYFDGKAMSANHGGEKISSLDPVDITKKVLEAFEHCHP